MLATLLNCSRRFLGMKVKTLYLLVRTWLLSKVQPGAGTGLLPNPRFSVLMTLPSSFLTLRVQPGMENLGAVASASGGMGALMRTWRG